MYFNFNQ